jgi:hypothetical protein
MLRSLLLLATISCHAISPAQQFVRHAIAEPDLRLPQCIAVADIDGDGDRDVVANSQGRRNLVWYANNGSGGFGPMNLIYQATAWIGTIVNHFEVADIDGDGDMDIASVWDTGTNTYWHKNIGGGAFTTQLLGTAPDYYRGVHVMDANGDGDLEVFEGLFSNGVRQYTNLGAGAFSSAAAAGTYPSSSGRSLHSNDLDLDGDLDLLSASSTYGFYRLNNGSGTFGPAVQTCPSQGVFHTDDVDGDGDLDAITTYSNAVWLRKTAPTLFGTQVQLLTGTLPSLIRTADLDLDGDRDIILVRGCDLIWLPNNGNANFGAAQVIDGVNGASWVAHGDLNGDALPELVAIGSKGPVMYVNNGGGVFGPATVLSPDQSVYKQGLAAQLNGSGPPEVLSWSMAGVQIHPNMGQGVFGQHINVVAEENAIINAAYGDMDLDGDLDVVSARPGGNNGCTTTAPAFLTALNNGTGGFATPAVLPGPVGQTLQYLALADMDQDGDSDVVSIATSALFVHLNNNGPLFQAQSIPQGGTTFQVGDLDADGDPDILFGVDANGIVQWRQNNGQGVLSTNTINGVGTGHFVDLDGDSDLDVVTAQGNMFIAMRNNGGTFATIDTVVQFTSIAANSTYLASGDLDGDGDKDLVMSRPQGSVQWFTNTGACTFGPSITIMPSDLLYENGLAVPIEVADLDADGDADILTGADRMGRLHWIENAGLRMRARVFLEGPYVTANGLMNDALRAQPAFPLSQPFTALGFANVMAGSINASVLTVSGTNAVVDWILVELRHKNNSAQVITAIPALLQRDGDIVALDGTSALWIDQPADLYYLAVRHRNHLGVMTLNTVPLNGSFASVDLTNGSVPLYGTATQKQVGSAWACWAGNVVANDQLKYTGASNDRDPILLAIGGGSPTSTTTGYRAEDCNLDGVVKYTGAANDRDIILINIGGSSPTLTRNEQLP